MHSNLQLFIFNWTLETIYSLQGSSSRSTCPDWERSAKRWAKQTKTMQRRGFIQNLLHGAPCCAWVSCKPTGSQHALLLNVSSCYRITTKSMPPPPPPPPPLTACTSRSIRTFTLSSWGWEYLLIARYDNHYYQFPYWKQNNVLNKRDGKCIMREVACRVTF